MTKDLLRKLKTLVLRPKTIIKRLLVKRTFSLLTAMLVSHFLLAQFPSDTIFTHTELMPYFAGCEQFTLGEPEKRRCSDEQLVRFIARHLTYPETAKAAEIEGTVYVSFVVDETGLVTSPSILMDIGAGCGAAALKVISEMPNWEAGQQNGQPVKVRLNLPIQFFLRESDPDFADQYNLTWGTVMGDSATKEELKANLGNPVFVRDAEGNDCMIDELAFTFEKNKRLVNTIGRGGVPNELGRVVGKIKPGGVFTITASVQDEGRFVYVTKSYQIVEQ